MTRTRAVAARAVRVAGGVIALALSTAPAGAQPWRAAAARLGTTTRVLLVGARPEDEDNALIAWLSLGRNVETAYLSLTRGESGMNLIGTGERQATLAVVRTAELLAERQRDGARQYFTRAYDFGPAAADSVVDAAWPHEVLLADVVSVVRAFRPHVVISLGAEAGEPDATRRRAARLAAEAFAAAADTVRLPAAATARLPAWSVSRLFTLAGGAAPGEQRTVTVDVGEFHRGVGRSYAEIGADVRRLQRSQGAPAAPSLGPLPRVLRLESSRVDDDPAAAASLFGALDTAWTRFDGALPAEARAQLDTLRSELGAVRATAADVTADSLAVRLARVARRTSEVRVALPCRDVAGVPACPGTAGDLAVVLGTVRERAVRAMLGAAGLVIDGVVARQLVAAGDSVPVVATVYNGGRLPVELRRLAAVAGGRLSFLLRDSSLLVPPDGVLERSAQLRMPAPTYHWWQVDGLVGGAWIHALRGSGGSGVVPQLIGGEDRVTTSALEATVAIAGVEVPVIVRPLAHRGGTAPRGDVRQPLAGVPATSVLLERTASYERAALPVDRIFRVFVQSARSTPDTVTVRLALPSGLRTDSTTRTVALPPFGSRNVFFRLVGTLRPRTDSIAATGRSVATVAAVRAMQRDAVVDVRHGVVTHEYPHIPAQQFVRFATERLEAVDVRLPPRLHVAYVPGTDDVRTPLQQLRVKVQTLDPALIPVVDLSTFSTVLVGADALEGDAWAAAVPALHAFVRNGGTVVVLPGGAEVGRSGLLPYPVAFDEVPRQLRDPDAAVRVTDPRSSLLAWPHAITADDFARWTNSRARHVPATFDPRYRTPLLVGAADERPTPATILVARLGRGTIVYTSLSVDRQLEAVHPGAAKLMINLLAAGLAGG